jgi:MATE family multidrug resistance protein
MGYEQATSAIIGQQIGKGDLNKAKQFYRSFRIVMVINMLLSCLFLYMIRIPLICMFTKDQKLIDLAESVIWILTFSTFPDGYKGMLKGVVRAIGIQHIALYVNLMGHWVINLSLQYLLAFYFEMRMPGMWFAKLFLEYFIMISYLIVLSRYDW